MPSPACLTHIIYNNEYDMLHVASHIADENWMKGLGGSCVIVKQWGAKTSRPHQSSFEIILPTHLKLNHIMSCNTQRRVSNNAATSDDYLFFLRECSVWDDTCIINKASGITNFIGKFNGYLRQYFLVCVFVCITTCGNNTMALIDIYMYFGSMGSMRDAVPVTTFHQLIFQSR